VAEVTKSELALAKARASQQDAALIIAALEADGNITVVDDPEAEVEVDEETGEENIVVAPKSDFIQISVESEEEEEEEEKEED
jgi:hypothetical protein